MDDEKRIEKLIKSMHKPGKDALRASTALADMGALAVVPLIRALHREEDAYVRKLVALSLGRIGEPAIDPLIKSLDDEDPAVRRHAVEALGRIRSQPRVLGAIFKARKDPNEDVRRAAWVALERFPPPTMGIHNA